MKTEISIPDLNKMFPNIEVVGVDDKVSAYRFTGGALEGVTYTYVNIHFKAVNTRTNEVFESLDDADPDNEEHAIEVEFSYIILENPLNKDIDSKSFKEYIGSILVRIVEASVDADAA